MFGKCMYIYIYIIIFCVQNLTVITTIDTSIKVTA